MRIALVTDTSVARRLMRWITHLGGATATVAAALALVALGERATGVTALLANLLSHVPVQILKRLVQRPRPCDAQGRPLALVDLPDPFSFPSGHAAAATAVAASVAVAHPVAGAVVLPLAGLVAASRVHLRVHHPGDVVAGACLGLAGAIAASAILR
ncbi:MAG TPA: phosphatase PAP2 family protein [Gemmatimonadales bacterium]|nr:phosphatase PAP2 family protein [Gemmatimonadales bacterium]